MEIKIEDYLKNSEIKDIIVEELRNKIRNNFSEKDITRIISNAPYYKAYDIFDECLPEGYKDDIKEKVLNLRNNPKSYDIFRYNYYSKKPENVGAKIIEESIAENKDLIIENVQNAINNSNNIYEKFVDNFLYKIDCGFTIKIKGE